MPAKGGKTVRFDALVKASGAPEQVTLWTAPAENRDFMRAVEQQRVATVVQHNVGSAKDFGLVGFHQLEKATFLVFPKQLSVPDKTRIIGIKYEKLAESKPSGPLYEPAGGQAKKRSNRESRGNVLAEVGHEKRTPRLPLRKEPPVPKRFVFRANVDLIAKQRLTIEVTAATATDAARLVKERAAEMQFDPALATISLKVSKPVKQARAS